MSNGSYTIGGGPTAGIYAKKVWNGANDPVNHRTENAYSMQSERWDRTMNGLYDKVTKRVYRTEYSFFPIGVMPAPVTGAMEVEVQSKLSEVVRGHEFNMAVFGAQLPQAAQQLVGMCQALASVVRAARKRDPVALARAMSRILGHKPKRKDIAKAVRAKEVGEMWLALKYGLEPTISDLYSAAKAYEASTQRRRTIHRTSKVWKSTANDSASPSTYELKCTMTRGVSYKIICSETLSVPRNLGLLDPASVAWELIPFSFVVDWFIPIGDYLENLSILGSMHCICVRSELAKAESKLTRGINTVSTLSIGGSCNARRCQLTRTVTTTIPVQKPSLKSWAKALSVDHLKNAGALLLALRR